MCSLAGSRNGHLPSLGEDRAFPMATGTILGAELRLGGLLVASPAGISHLSWEIKTSHTLVRVQSSLPGPCSSRAGIATLAVGTFLIFHLDSVTHPMLVWESALCLRVLGAMASSGLWLLLSGARQVPGIVAQPQAGRGVRPCVCAMGSLVPGVPWVSLCSAVAVPSATAAVPVCWRCPGVSALSQCAKGG